MLPEAVEDSLLVLSGLLGGELLLSLHVTVLGGCFVGSLGLDELGGLGLHTVAQLHIFISYMLASLSPLSSLLALSELSGVFKYIMVRGRLLPPPLPHPTPVTHTTSLMFLDLALATGGKSWLAS